MVADRSKSILSQLIMFWTGSSFKLGIKVAGSGEVTKLGTTTSIRKGGWSNHVRPLSTATTVHWHRDVSGKARVKAGDAVAEPPIKILRDLILIHSSDRRKLALTT